MLATRFVLRYPPEASQRDRSTIGSLVACFHHVVCRVRRPSFTPGNSEHDQQRSNRLAARLKQDSVNHISKAHLDLA